MVGEVMEAVGPPTPRSGAPWFLTHLLLPRLLFHGWGWSGWAASVDGERTVTASTPCLEPSGSPTLGPQALGVPLDWLCKDRRESGSYPPLSAHTHIWSLQGITLGLQLQLQSGSGAVRELHGIPA